MKTSKTFTLVRFGLLLASISAFAVTGCQATDGTESDESDESEVTGEAESPLPIKDNTAGSCLIYSPYNSSGSWEGWGWKDGVESNGSCYIGPDRVTCGSAHAYC